jgi:polynucleotide 5'-kinase involved in rRNA processing
MLREYGYRRYLEGSKVWAFPANPDNARMIVATQGSKAGTGISPSLQLDLRNLIIGLVDARGFALGIGILMEYDRRQHSMKIYSPHHEGVVGIEVGNIRLGLDGTEIGYLNEPL